MLKIKKKTIKNIIKFLFIIGILAELLFVLNNVVFAGDLQSTKLLIGTENLAKAIINWLVGIGITVCGGYFVYYVFCLKTNDEGERRRNIQNIKNTLIAMVLITTGLALIDAILSFYK